MFFSEKNDNFLSILDLKKMNNLKLSKIDLKRFPVLKILKKLPKKHSLFETVIVSINDFLVENFLKKKKTKQKQSKVFKTLKKKKLIRICL